jgi:hypothetical protein
MKKIVYSFLLAASLLGVSGCKKEDTANVSRLVDVTEPGLILNGDDLIILPTGTAYQDPGAIGIDSLSGNKQTELTPLTLPNVNVPGLYPLIYRAKNANGFTVEATRNVFVFDNTLTEGYTLITNQDLSGTYKHTNAPGRIVTVVQASPGLYICNDLYGTFTPTPLYFLNTTDGLVIPEQPTYTGLGDIQGTGTISITATGKYILDFAGLERVGCCARPRKITQQ